MEKFNKDIQSDKVWAHLDTMYNLEVLDESESLPFPNDEQDFTLPQSEFGELQHKKEDRAEAEKKQAAVQKGRETPKNMKEIKKEEKTPVAKQNVKEKDKERRDSKDSRDGKVTNSVKKEVKKEKDEKPKPKGRASSVNNGDEKAKGGKGKQEETPRAPKRTRGSLKPDDTGSNGKASPVTVTASATKRRRVQ